jgi:hypothetical protein
VDDINDTIEQSKGLYIFIAAAVIDQGNTQTSLDSSRQGCKYLRQYMCRGDKINIVAAHSLKFHHRCSELVIFHLQAIIKEPADFKILTETDGFYLVLTLYKHSFHTHCKATCSSVAGNIAGIVKTRHLLRCHKF